MSLPQRPGKVSPRRDDHTSFRDPPRRRRRDSQPDGDLNEHYYHHHRRRSSGGNNNNNRSSRPHRNRSSSIHRHRYHRSSSSRRPLRDGDEERNLPGAEVRQKKNLVKPERSRIDSGHPNYHYRQRSQKMPTYPSATGNDPLAEGDANSAHSAGDEDEDDEEEKQQERMDRLQRGPGRQRKKRRSSRKISKQAAVEERQRQEAMEQVRPPSPWTAYCALVTFWAPNFILECFGMPQKAQRSAWREKMGLISVILLIAAFVGFLTFGFTATVCGTPPLRLKANQINTNYMIFQGSAYDLTKFSHPAAVGIPDHTNVLYDLPHKYGGQDGSFLFQEVNGACKGLITPADGSDVPTNDNGDLAWYFPCLSFNQDGSSEPNLTVPHYLGWGCHTSGSARRQFWGMQGKGDVYYTWEDTKNTSRNLAVYSGNVLDLDLLRWMNTSQVQYPSKFDDIRTNPDVRGVDLTYYFQTGQEKQIGKCLSQIIKVGSIDTDTVGCIASKVVLYVSLVFILSIVIVKFAFALIFQWFMAPRFAAQKTSMDSRTRNQQIEDWSNDIYRPGPRLADPPSDRSSRRPSFLPTTSRFSSPYTASSGGKQRVPYITMASQNSTSRLMPPAAATSGYNDGSVDTPSGEPTIDADGNHGGLIHTEVVPQPPPEWQPYGFPLAHTLCLVTCYSEGEEGIRTTLDSIALTDYPNSHKAIIVICDGVIKGKGEDYSTPEIVLRMMKDPIIPTKDVHPFSYVAVATGSKRHNMAKVYAGFYDYGDTSIIPPEKQQRVPMMIIVKSGTRAESRVAKPGNRGKRDSQIILMSFLQKVMFDERMTELEFEMFNGLWNITGIPPDFYEVVLMVDADTKVFPDSLTHMISAMVKDPEVMGLCGETKIANKTQSWVTMIQVFEYFISHHQSKSFESVFGGVTCLPGCFTMYRIKTPKGGQNYWVPILANPDIVEHYSENVVDTLHKKNLLLLGEDRYLTTLMLKTFPKRKQIFVPQAVCKTVVPEKFRVLLSQRRRWINSTVHNLFELMLVRDLCGTFCFSMQFVIFIELVGTLVLPAAIAFTFYVVISSIVNKPVQVIPLVLLALILGLPGVLIIVTANRLVYVLWMLIYLLSLPIWNFVLPTYAYWKFDDFSWGDTRKTAGEQEKKGLDVEGEFDSSKITMKRWRDFERGMSF